MQTAEKATYNITSDRLKVWFPERLSAGDYDAMKRAGFQFWHGSKCFTAIWTPEREDLITSAGVIIEADDTPDDVETRVQRFEKYAERAQDHAAGGESRLETANTERRKENALAAIEKGLTEAEHWQRRIAGAIQAAAYKERPDVIARRIEKLSTDLRKYERDQQRKNWRPPGECWDDAATTAYHSRKAELEKQLNADKVAGNPWTPERKAEAVKELRELGAKVFKQPLTDERFAAHCAWRKRWADHVSKRLQYERANLAAAGGIVAHVEAAPMDKEKFQVGGAILTSRDKWRLITKVNKRTVEVFDPGCHWRHWWKVDRTEITDVASPERVKTELASLLNHHKALMAEIERHKADVAAFEKKHGDKLDGIMPGWKYSELSDYDKCIVRVALREKIEAGEVSDAQAKKPFAKPGPDPVAKYWQESASQSVLNSYGKGAA